MSWTPIMPEATGKAAPYPVSISLNKKGGRFKQRLVLTIRTSAVEDVAHWCHPDAEITVEAGNGENAGSFRLSPGGPWRFRRSSGRIKAVSLVMRAPPGSPPEGCRQLAVPITHGPGFLTFTLPSWGVLAARAVEHATAAAKPAPEARRPATDAKAPFVSICDRVADPAMAIQHANGARVR